MFSLISKFIDTERLTHSVKTAIACLIGLAMTKVINLPADQWVVITIIVVMCAQLYVGSVVQKAYLRFIGTVIGCLFAIVTLLTLGDSHFAIFFIITFSSFVFSYFATTQENSSYIGTLGAVTTAIIMLVPQPTVLFAIQRLMEIGIGLLIATLVSQFILPIRASTHLRRAQAATLRQLRDFYTAAIVTHAEQPDTFDYHELDETIVKSLLKQRQLAKESRREPLSNAFDPDHFMDSLFSEREILRSINFMHSALLRLHKSPIVLELSTSLKMFNETILQSFTTIIRVIETESTFVQSVSDEHIHEPSLVSFKENFRKDTQVISQDEMLYLDGFVFSAEILADSISKLAKIYHIAVREERPQPPLAHSL